jgi:hypothetical protein
VFIAQGGRRIDVYAINLPDCTTKSEATTRHRGLRRADALRDFCDAVAFDQRDLVLALQLEPELRLVAEIAAKRTAVSGVTPRRPFRMPMMRLTDTPTSSASRLA